jgi:hypothetical protein
VVRAALLLGLLLPSSLPVHAAAVPSVAFVGFSLINTEPTKPEEEARLKMIEEFFRQKLDASGRFKIVPVSAEAQKKLGQVAIENCNGCEKEAAIVSGADWAPWGTVLKSYAGFWVMR